MGNKKKFRGYYFRHQKDGRTVAFIPGTSGSGAFVQVITDRRSYNFAFSDASMGREISVGGCVFRPGGIHVDLPRIRGDIIYSSLTPVKYDVMGPFRFFPMECRHTVLSMRHTLTGSLSVDGEDYDFDGGVGYIEGDSGVSFPRRYLWLMANDFDDSSGVMLSLAEIPFLGLRFEGCICIIVTGGREYRFATYLGVKISVAGNKIVLTQGRLRLEAAIISAGEGHTLASPAGGIMSGIIREHNNAEIIVRLFYGGEEICALRSRHAGFENRGFTQGI